VERAEIGRVGDPVAVGVERAVDRIQIARVPGGGSAEPS
jgi:hypothetical protein